MILWLNEEYFIEDTKRNANGFPSIVQGDTQNLLGIIYWVASDQVLLSQRLFIWQPIQQELCEGQLFFSFLEVTVTLHESYQ